MKSLIEFINESEIKKIRNLKVSYKALKPVVICVPSSYSESDMQIYLDDKCLDLMPGSSDSSKKVLGENIKEINDAYFLYDKLEESDKTTEDVDLEWDPKYDSTYDGSTYIYFTLKNLKYIIEFSEFDINDIDNTEESLKKIFESFNSSTINKYPFVIELDNIDYDEQ